MTPDPAFDAIILAGGRGTRLGGRDKPALVYRDATLLEHTIRAVSEARRIVVVGDRPALPGVLHAVEDPMGGGPAAAVGAGLSALGEPAELVAVLASDVPEIGSAFARLRAAGAPAVAVDGDGRTQHLLGLYPAAELLARAQGNLHGWSMRRLLEGLSLQHVVVDAPDVDHPHDAARFGIAL